MGLHIATVIIPIGKMRVKPQRLGKVRYGRIVVAFTLLVLLLKHDAPLTIPLYLITLTLKNFSKTSSNHWTFLLQLDRILLWT